MGRGRGGAALGRVHVVVERGGGAGEARARRARLVVVHDGDVRRRGLRPVQGGLYDERGPPVRLRLARGRPRGRRRLRPLVPVQYHCDAPLVVHDFP